MAQQQVTNVSAQVLYTISNTNVRVTSASVQVLRSIANAPASTQGAITTTIT